MVACRTWVFAFLVMAGLTPVVAAQPLPRKSVAAPPEDFFRLQMPDPSEHGITSRSAMVPVELRQTADGSWQWNGSLALEEGGPHTVAVVAPRVGEWRVSLETRDGTVVLDPLSLERSHRFRDSMTYQVQPLSLGSTGFAAEVFRFERLPSGQIPVRVESARPWVTPPGEADGYLLVGSATGQPVYSHLRDYDLTTERDLGIVAYVCDVERRGGRPPVAPGKVEAAFARIHPPSGRSWTKPLFDDGQHGDGAVGDGVYGALFQIPFAGESVVQVDLRGRRADGSPFHRTTQHLVSVHAPTLRFGGNASVSADDPWIRVNFPLEVVGRRVPDSVQIGGELWGADRRGKTVPVAWIGGIRGPRIEQGRAMVSLELSTEWLWRAGVLGAFELRNVRLQDPNTGLPWDRRPVVSVDGEPRLLSGRTAGSSLTPSMLQGAPPGLDRARMQALRGTSALMLVHGYCSGGVWPTSDFTDSLVFEDFSQSRSHDEFAQLLAGQASGFDSFGVVGHSQGGAAALHLLTYYWSGLDDATGGRKIQSVGTPYQGTALAGNLALLGQIFGAGCGENFDLTYDGAALWLAGIPTWARQEVFYYTTSKENPGFLSSCIAATDLFLTNPEDGTTEQWAGQLPGANNMGHVEGWCHTTGMNDPPQYQDSARNQQMNQAAAR